MKFEEMKSRVPNLKRIENKVNALIEGLNNAQDAKEAIKIVKKYFKIQDEYTSDSTIISIRFTLDTTNKEYVKANDKLNEISPIISGIFENFERAMMASKFKTDLEKKYGTLLFKMIENSFKCFDKKVIPLLQEENKLVSEYDALLASAQIEYEGETLNLSQLGKYMSDKNRVTRLESARLYYRFLEENDAKIGDIYDKLVKLRTKIAHELGFKNYVELGYLRLGRVDFNADMVASYREQIKKDVVPVVHKFRIAQAKRLGLKKPVFVDYNLFFEEGNAKPAGDKSRKSWWRLYDFHSKI